MLNGMKRELLYLLKHKWDLCLVTLAPLFIIILFSAMFAQGKPEHLPIAIIDQDNSRLSQNIEHYISLNHTLNIETISASQSSVETLLNQNKVWGYIHIPNGAEQRLVQSKDAQISIVFNQSYFSVGNTISSAMFISTAEAMTNFLGDDYFKNVIPNINTPYPHIKISPLYNPELNYEFYLEPYMVPAVLHLLLCCCVAFAVGQEFKYQTASKWVNNRNFIQAILSKNLVYIFIFTFWTWLWMFWLISIRGWFIAGSLSIILIGQFLFYSAYALISTVIVLVTKDLTKTFGLIAVYGGSSLSFAGVTLPLNNAPIFTKFWANIIPYTPYAKLQTEQWVIGSSISVSLISLMILALYVVIYLSLSIFLLKKYFKGIYS